jgi:prepilin-type N-terminal cleavage/methylation domain-containing protein
MALQVSNKVQIRKEKEASDARKKSTEKGFGLVEFLIAIAIFSVLIVGVLYGSYDSQTKTYELETRKIDLRRNLQQAMEDISKELRMAGAITSSSANAISFTSVQDGNLRSFTFSSDEEKLRYTNGSKTKTYSGISQFTVITYPSAANRITISIEGKTIHRGKAYYQGMTSDVTIRNV